MTIEMFQPNLVPTTTSSSHSYSGLAPGARGKIETGIVPMLVERARALPATIDNYTKNASGLYENLSRQAMTRAMPDILNGLAARNMLNSSVASDSIAKTMGSIVPTFANYGYAAGMEGAKMQAQVPDILGRLAELAKYNETSSTTVQKNPLAPFELMAQVMANL